MIINRQRRIRVSLELLGRFLMRLQRVLNLPSGVVTVCFVSEVRIAGWNEAYRGKEGPTDVLSFRSDETRHVGRRGEVRNANRARRGTRGEQRGTTGRSRHGAELPYLGDVAIAPAVAQRNARRLGRTLYGELCILILHGVLHLMGYDHETDRGEMDRREARLRRRLKLA
jgi:probable rRNA maturation factor